MRRRVTWSAMALAVVLAVTACSDDGGEPSPADGNGIVRIGLVEPQHLIPSNATESAGAQVIAALFTPLVDFDGEKKPFEVAAESIESSDNKLWTVKLKGGYTFHNGEPVTADSYINAWNHAAYGPNGNGGAYFFGQIDGYDDLQSTDPDGDGPQKAPEPKAKKLTGLQKVDELTFTITLSGPFAEFESVLGYHVFSPLPAAAWASDGVLKDGFEEALIGNGPFKMKGTWQHDSRIEVERYDAHPGTKPKIGGVVFQIYQALTADYADLVAGNNDVTKTIPTEHLASAPGDLGDRFKKSPLSSFQFLAFPTFQQEFAKPEVRKAISMAIDRDEIVKTIFKDSQTSARAFVSPAVAGARPDTCGEACVFDPAKAKAAYQAAGGPNRLQISYNGDGGHRDWIDATCNQLTNNLGVECVGTAETRFADLLTKVEEKTPVGMFRLGWSMDYPSMQNYLGPLYSTGGSSNYYGYSNPEFDRLVEEGVAAPNQDEAIKKYQQAEEILAREIPVIPLRFGQNNFGHSTRVGNVELDLFGQVDLLKIEVSG
ncbi:peptide/nickel transport system substrate-binding protein/oligopeptide transport system substrate-binding protein [Plantactinospora soyae]|uniref:Peptide/nickel transport system substrate-binding protein/oligopeptide transport system substrate-binding protein n=1 Tax=Plantactinospora soyae TaxID=1544732 RepID=A0A927MCS7_9ACTN|nr:peptide/nickel transport system substrate-binding protein/oligopeptide transport system substrate-binding protein [Plantactinospora soyae]